MVKRSEITRASNGDLVAPSQNLTDVPTLNGVSGLLQTAVNPGGMFDLGKALAVNSARRHADLVIVNNAIGADVLRSQNTLKAVARSGAIAELKDTIEARRLYHELQELEREHRGLTQQDIAESVEQQDLELTSRSVLAVNKTKRKMRHDALCERACVEAEVKMRLRGKSAEAIAAKQAEIKRDFEEAWNRGC